MNKVVIVEDSVLIREGLKTIVSWESMDCKIVAEAEDGEEGLEKIGELLPDIVITDIRMDDMDGLEMIEKAKRISPKTIYIILTGHREFEYACKAVELHAFAYLLKPVDSQKLCNKIKDAVSYLKTREESYQNELLQTLIKEIQHGEKNALTLYEKYIAEIGEDDFEKRKELIGMIFEQIYNIRASEEHGGDTMKIIQTEDDITALGEMTKLAIEQTLENQAAQEGRYGEVVEQMLEYIHSNYMHNIGVKEIAANTCNYSGYYVSKIFKKAMNCSVAEYLTKYRIDCAKKMIEEDAIPMKDIAFRCGFQDVNYFYKVFTKFTGITTKEYKDRVKAKSDEE